MSFVNETKTTPIQNDTGANVRADINSNMAAIYSLNASTAEPSADNSVARMIWADETTDELKIRNGTNTSFITIGSLNETNLGLAKIASPTFTGNVGVPAGTVSSLPIRRSDDTNTGIYFSAADTLDIATGGTRRAHFDSNGITIRDRKALRFRDTSNSNFVALRAPDNAAADITLTLPDNDGNNGEVLSTDGSGNLSFVAQPSAVPTGSVHQMATTTAPSGYLKCNGAAVSRTTYAALFAIIGTTWGAGDGSTTFNVPDLRGEFVRGWDDSRGVDSGRSFATSQADQNKSHNHSASSSVSDPGHSHVFQRPGFRTSLNDPQATSVAEFEYNANTSHQTTGISVSTSIGANGGNEARPRNIAMMYVIKT